MPHAGWTLDVGRNKDKPWFDDQCRRVFGLKQEAHLFWIRDRSRVNWEEFVSCQVRANEPTRRRGVSLVSKTGCSYEFTVSS